MPRPAGDRSPRRTGVGGLLRDVVLVSLGRYGQYVVTLVTIPLTARLLGPAGMGLLAIAMATYFLGALCTDLGLTAFVAARVPQPGLGRLRGTYAALRGTLLGLFVAAYVLVAALPTPRAVELGALGLAVGAASALAEDWVLIGRQRFGAVVVQQAAGRLVYLGLLVLVLPRIRTPEAAMICLFAGTVVSVTWSWARTVRDYGPPQRPGSPRDLLRTGGPALTARLLSATYGSSAATVFAPALPARSLGLFSAGDRVVQAAVSLLDAVGVSLLPRLARRTGDDFWGTARRTMLIVAALGAAIAACVTALAPWIVPLLFGDDFAAAVPLLQLEAWALPGAAVASFRVTAVLSVQRDARGVLYASLAGAVVIAVALAAALQTHSPSTAAAGIVAAQTVAAGVAVLRVRALSASAARASAS